jgi:hypothetical protein
VYPDETMETGAGFPALVRFEKNDEGAPLAVFITGGGVFARIAYGHPGGRPPDFLCHWLNEAGYSTLALTYPLGLSPFAQTCPTFTVTDWAEQTAEIIARYTQIEGLPTKVVVLAWSMAGRIAAPLTTAMRRRGVDIELFVAMSASPGLPNLLPGFASLAPDASGLARVEGAFLDGLLACLKAQNEENGRSAISAEQFLKEYTGPFPIALAAAGMRLRDGRFVRAPLEDQHDTAVFDFASYPPIAVLTHASALDARHALTDRAIWGMLIAKSLSEGNILARVGNIADVSPSSWSRVHDLVVGASERLTATVPGNHLFFVGEAGATRTVEAVANLRVEAAALTAELDEIVEGILRTA